MVTTFNVREIEEFANWTIKEHRLPKKFKIQLREGFDINPLYNVLEKLGLERGLRDSSFKTFNPKNILAFEKVGNGVVKSATIWHDVTYDDPSKFNDFALITEEELKLMLIYENTPLMTNRHIDNWLKFEKGIERVSTGKYIPAN